jgi:hypothetical protein
MWRPFLSIKPCLERFQVSSSWYVDRFQDILWGSNTPGAPFVSSLKLGYHDQKERSGEEMKREIYQHHIDLLAGSLYQRLHIPSTVHSYELVSNEYRLTNMPAAGGMNTSVSLHSFGGMPQWIVLNQMVSPDPFSTMKSTSRPRDSWAETTSHLGRRQVCPKDISEIYVSPIRGLSGRCHGDWLIYHGTSPF